MGDPALTGTLPPGGFSLPFSSRPYLFPSQGQLRLDSPWLQPPGAKAHSQRAWAQDPAWRPSACAGESGPSI